MKTLMTITVKVTRPFHTDNDEIIKAGHAESFAQTIEQMVRDELANYEITGLNVEVKVK